MVDSISVNDILNGGVKLAGQSGGKKNGYAWLGFALNATACAQIHYAFNILFKGGGSVLYPFHHHLQVLTTRVVAFAMLFSGWDQVMDGQMAEMELNIGHIGGICLCLSYSLLAALVVMHIVLELVD